jgi:hypothetical protein
MALLALVAGGDVRCKYVCRFATGRTICCFFFPEKKTKTIDVSLCLKYIDVFLFDPYLAFISHLVLVVHSNVLFAFVLLVLDA